MSDENELDGLTEIEGNGITVSSGFGFNSRKGYVQLLSKKSDWYIQIDLEAAKELALNILEASEAAFSDSAAMRFFTEVVDADDEHAAQFLVLMRDHRAVLKEQRANDISST